MYNGRWTILLSITDFKLTAVVLWRAVVKKRRLKSADTRCVSKNPGVITRPGWRLFVDTGASPLTPEQEPRQDERPRPRLPSMNGA